MSDEDRKQRRKLIKRRAKLLTRLREMELPDDHVPESVWDEDREEVILQWLQ